jgi:membrane-bound serine protease (ClpP class)
LLRHAKALYSAREAHVQIGRILGRLALPVALVLAVGAGLGRGEGTVRVALLAAIEGPIGPATVRHVERVVETAAARHAEVLILRLDTPGGLVESMREVIAVILASPTPVIGFVAPPGAHAASAGTYILYATHVAAMAPGTNLGAATPVQIGGFPGLPRDDERPADEGEGEPAPKPPADAMEAKAINDAVAFIRSLAELHGRNADWAEQAVREAASLSAARAKELGVIDLMAADPQRLLAAIDGRSVTVGGAERTLSTAGLPVESVEPDAVTRALGLLSNPNIAFLLMIVGVYGLIFEFASPGTFAPGVIGAISLVLGLYALNQLPLDYAGLALVGLGIAFMLGEALTPSFGALGLGGLVAFVIGAAMLVDTEVPAYRVSWWTIGGAAALSAAILTLLLGYALRVRRRPPSSGPARLVGAEAQVLDWSGGAGHVWAEGERWQASGAADLTAGAAVRIRGIDGITLLVAPAGGAPDREA